MNKFNYGTFDISNGDIAFASTNGYSNPSSELETRKQLSYPLKEVKTFVNNTVSVDSEDNAIQLVLTENGLSYRTEPGGSLTPIGGGGIDSIYPVGSIYMSVNNTNPSTLFSGTTWEQLKDRFLLGAGDTYSAGSTGGEATHKLTVEEMPSHNHSGLVTFQTGQCSGGDYNFMQSLNVSRLTSNTGGDQAHNNMPPYLAVYMWKRTA